MNYDYKPEDGTRGRRAWGLARALLETFESGEKRPVSVRALRKMTLVRLAEVGAAPFVGDEDGDLRASTDAVHELGLRKRKQADEVLIFVTPKNAEKCRAFLRDPDSFIGGDAITDAAELLSIVGPKREITMSSPSATSIEEIVNGTLGEPETEEVAS